MKRKANNVDTVGGIVTLHGKVASEPAKAKAEMVAKSMGGVKSVKNLLQVVPKPQRDAVELKGDAIGSVSRQPSRLTSRSSRAASVNHGVVLLSGNSKSHAMHLKALEEALKIPGVRRVASEVKVGPTATT